MLGWYIMIAASLVASVYLVYAVWTVPVVICSFPASAGTKMMASSKIQSQDDCKVESLKFGYNLTISLSQLLVKHCLCDTTLVTSDGTLSAHRVILAASSGFFQSVFSLPSLHQTLHPVIYLRNIKTVHMRSILHFLYTGVANVSEDDVDQFIKIATDLKIEGLMMENNKRGRKKKTKTSLNDEKKQWVKSSRLRRW